MSSNGLKSWQIPWSTEEIIKNSSNWSLAGDAGLLKYLESFSENLLTKAEETNNNLNKLLSGLNNASLALDEAKNDFRTLRNTQFIESRVYEDDETVPEENKSQEEEDKKQSEEEKMKEMKDAILAGIHVVEKYFDKVEVSASDSEDESDFTSFVLKPKDPYIDRPLPFIIGTEDWHKKWHVGLLDSSSESEADKVSEKFSDSDSESDLSYSEDKISDDFLNSGSNVNQPAANSTFNDSSKPPDLFGESDVENTDSLAYAIPKNNNFANELASKLGKYADEGEVNKKPINTSTSRKQYDYLFSDEPPPIDDFNENNNDKGLFSGGEGLFDDTDNAVNLWNEDVQKKIDNGSKAQNLFDDEDDLFNETISYGNNSTKSKDHVAIESISGGLFDDEDDDLFNDNITQKASSNITSYLTSGTKTTIPFLAEEPPELEPSIASNKTESKKPFGGVKLIGKSDLFENKKVGDLLKQSRQSSLDNPEEDKGLLKSDSKTFDTYAEAVVKTEPDKKPKKLSLFDDDDDDGALFENDLFSNFSSKSLFDTDLEIGKEKPPNCEPEKEMIHSGDTPKPSTLFDDYGDNEDLFSTSVLKSQKLEEDDSKNGRMRTPDEIPPLSSVYDSNPPDINDWDTQPDNIFDDGALFDNIPEMSSQRSSLFDSEPPSLFFDSSGIVKDFSTRLGSDDDSFIPHATSTRRYSTDVFNEEQSNDSLFVAKNKSQVEHQHVHSNLGIIPEASFSHNFDASESNLEITPSGDIDDLLSNTTVDNIEFKSGGDDSKLNKTQVEVESNKVDEEKVPNSVLTKPDSPGKLKHNLKINVDALIPGASPPKKKQIIAPPTIEVTESHDVSQSANSPREERPNKEASLADAEVLPSMTKDRVRIPIKRRPSTRKARQESLRKSVPDFKILSIINDPDRREDTKKMETEDRKTDFTESAQSNSDSFESGLLDGDFNDNSPVFVDDPIQTVDDDCLSVAQKVTSILEVQPKNIVADQPKRPHIDSDSFETEDYKQLNLFDDNEEFDDIFSSKKLPPKSNILKESLFDDDLDDDDDIFGVSTSFNKKPLPSKSTTVVPDKKVIKTNQIKKLENSEVVEDPLSSFLDN